MNDWLPLMLWWIASGCHKSIIRENLHRCALVGYMNSDISLLCMHIFIMWRLYLVSLEPNDRFSEWFTFTQGCFVDSSIVWIASLFLILICVLSSSWSLWRLIHFLRFWLHALRILGWGHFIFFRAVHVISLIWYSCTYNREMYINAKLMHCF